MTDYFHPTPRTPNLAVFCDFENVALGVKDARFPAFDWSLVLARLLDKGKIIAKRAYCDWDRYKSAKKGLHEAGFELIEVPHVRYSGKNSADIRMVVDAMDLCYQKDHVDIFVLVTGDSDFSPLASKLRENNKLVVGLGVRNSTSALLVESCDEFIFYDDLVTVAKRSRRRRGDKKADVPASDARATTEDGASPASDDDGGKRKRGGRGRSKDAKDPKDGPEGDKSAAAERDTLPDATPEDAIDWVVDTAAALFAEHDTVWGSMVKQTLKRKRPHFNEGAHGFRNFSALLEAAQSKGLLSLKRDKQSGGYVVVEVTGDE